MKTADSDSTGIKLTSTTGSLIESRQRYNPQEAYQSISVCGACAHSTVWDARPVYSNGRITEGRQDSLHLGPMVITCRQLSGYQERLNLCMVSNRDSSTVLKSHSTAVIPWAPSDRGAHEPRGTSKSRDRM